MGEVCNREVIWLYTLMGNSLVEIWILDELTKYDADFLCLQEVNITQYEDYFCVNLGEKGYKGPFWPKSRYKTMNDTDRRQVNRCARLTSMLLSYLLELVINFF